MALNMKCFCVARQTYSSFLFLNNNRKCKLVPFRCFFKFGSGGRSQKKSINKSSDESSDTSEIFKTKPYSVYDDPTFSDRYDKEKFDINTYKEGYKAFVSHASRYYKEKVQEIQERRNPRVDSKKNRVDILYKFETPEDINKFTVSTDSGFNMGYSSASLRLTENETAIFSGNIDTTVPKSGIVQFSGYAFITGPRQQRAFFLYKPYNWTEYTHLVFKIRGDGRTYIVLLHTPNVYEEMYFTQYGHQLHTRGGPYWQIVKIPFSHFFYIVKGKFRNLQFGRVPLDNISKLGISVALTEGPFKLEIDYIGLEYIPCHKKASCFELYEMKL